ncbi:MAG: ribonuclease H [Cyanobacteriota bacterium]|nr:ribonuclease H [Cyanobacteriota bacterium]
MGSQTKVETRAEGGQADGGRVLVAACDGACSGNPGPGGWGALLRFEDGSVREWGGSDPATTNNRMELTAALEVLRALRTLPRHPQLVILTDSRYLIDGLQKWMSVWKRKGWRTAAGAPVLNRDLWEQLDGARLAGVELRHVRGHSGHPENDRCDAIAVAYSRGMVPRLAGPPTRATASPPGPERLATPMATAPDDAEASVSEDPAPPALRRLLSRLEVADRLAAGGHGLTAVELAQLVEQPLAQLERRQGPWRWRDWLVEPIEPGRWRLRRADGGWVDAV